MIYLKENIFAGSDTFLGSDITDSDGRYSITWIADAPETRPIFSVFEGSFSYSDARSEVQIQVEEETPQDQPAEMQYHPTEISIPVSSETAYEGDIIAINGKLSDDGNAVANALIYIKDEDPLDADDIISTVITDSEGRYSFNWIAEFKDPFDNYVELYAVFEGSQYYSSVRSIQIDVLVSSDWR